MLLFDRERYPLAGVPALFVFLAIGLLISFLLIGPLLKSKIGLVDENDIAHYLGAAGYLKLSDVAAALYEKTNVFSFGKSPLVRPIYYAGRVLETALWGSEGSYWYALRVFMFGIVIGTMIWIYTRYVGLLMAAALTVFSLSFAMWSDIWGRSSGVSEQYATFGVALFAIGLVLLIDRWRDEGKLRIEAILISVGALTAIGSKENMLPLMVPLVLVLAFGLWHRRLDAIGIIALIVALAVGGWVCVSVGLYMLAGKAVDMYGNAPSVRAALVSPLMLKIYGVVAIGAVVALGINVFTGKFRGVDAQRAHRSLALRLLIGLSIIVAIVFSQQIVYSSQLPAHQRYDFPAVFGVPAAIILVVLAGRETISLIWPDWRGARWLVDMTVCAMLIGYSSLVTWRLSPAIAANIQRNTAFDSALTATTNMAAAHPDWPIILRSYNPWDLEIIQSIGRWLVVKGVKNPRFLVYVIDPEASRTAFESGELDQSIAGLSRAGIPEVNLRPLADLRISEPSACFVIALREPGVFATERQSEARTPGLDCTILPIRIYWNKGLLIVLPPGKLSQ